MISIKSTLACRVTYQEIISTGSCDDTTGSFEQQSLVSCDTVSGKLVTGEESLVIVQIFEQEALGSGSICGGCSGGGGGGCRSCNLVNSLLH